MSQDILIPLFKYYPRTVTIANGSNDEIRFEETSGAGVTATIASGTYTYGELAYQVHKALEAAGSNAYDVRYRYSTRRFTITSDGAFLKLDWNVGDDALPTLGFTSDQTGDTTYTSDTQVPSQTTLTFTRNSRGHIARRVSDRVDVVLASGRSESVLYGGSDEYSFYAELETRAVAQGFYDMVKAVGEHGAVIDYYPDSTDAVNYIQVQMTPNSWEFREMTAERLYGLFHLRMDFRVAVPNAGTLEMRDLIDRGPTS